MDVFDPGTGEVRTGDVNDIACWLIDTDYDGQSFFVRHAYFFCGRFCLVREGESPAGPV